MFENKNFNQFKRDMSHLTFQEISDLIYDKWKFQLSEDERKHYSDLAKLEDEEYYKQHELVMSKINALRKQIHDIKFAPENPAVKASGKLKFMTAYRFFRREKVPQVKDEHPALDGKDRQNIIKKLWRDMNDDQKYAYVLMSRADKERAIYISKLNQLRENLIRKYPHLRDNTQAKDRIETQIIEELTKNHQTKQQPLHSDSEYSDDEDSSEDL